jgi:predicted DCC family thiol-disulfide oxidoreductase YuxK
MANKNLILLYDGHCGLCNGSVNFILNHDKNGSMKFTPLQSELGQSIIEKFKLINLDSLVLYDSENEIVFYKSKAVIEIANYLGGIYYLCNLFRIIPRFILDYFYDLIAKNRYKIFGKYDTCRFPTTEEKSRIIE